MYLSRIELIGFKSFAHKTKIVFNDGITAIVGPNGCGKTNIVDAIRWVLGEQKSSVLRSERMEDVIFGGTMNRRRLGFAEVSLVIENTKNILPIEYSEIMITRRLYRSGESEYLLNKQICRLKDISNLLMDSGMGADAYSVIELSMVEMILNDRDDYRKRLFEEASGITKYKAKRNEALRKLDATKQDLVRVKDIITEVERNVRALKTQVNRAQRYGLLKNDLLLVEKQYYVCRQTELTDRKKPLEEEINELTNQHTSLSGKSVKSKAMIDKVQSDILENQAKLAKAQDDLNKFSDRVRNTDSNHAKLQERLVSLQDTHNRLLSEINSFEAKSKDIQNRSKAIGRDIDRVGKELADSKSVLEECESNRSEFQESYNRKKKIFSENNKQILETVKNLEESKRQKDFLQNDIQNREARLEALHSREEKARKRFADLQEEEAKKSTEKETVSTQLREIKSQKEEHLALHRTCDSDIKTLESKLHNCQITCESMKTKKAFLENLIEEFSGYSSGAGAILRAKNTLKGVLGTVGDLVSVPKDFRTAVGAALGEQSHYVVIDSWKNVHDAVQYLRSSGEGRATFISMEGIESSVDPVIPKNTTLSRAVPLIDKLTVSKKFQKLLNLLIGDFYYIDEEDIPADVLELNSSQMRIVNKNGDVISAGSMYHGGSIEEDSASIVGRKERISELNTGIQKIEKQIRSLEQSLNKKTAIRNDLQEKLSSIDMALESTVVKLESVNHNLGLTSFELRQISQNLKSMESEAKQLELFKDTSSKLDTLTSIIEKFEKLSDALQNKQIEFQEEERSLEKERVVIDSQYTEASANVTRAQESLSGYEREKKRHEELYNEYNEEVKKRKVFLQENKTQTTQTRTQIQRSQKELEQLFSVQHEHEELVLACREELNSIQTGKKDDLDGFIDLQKQLDNAQTEIQIRKEQLIEIQQELKFLEDTVRSKGINPLEIDIENEEMDVQEIVVKKERLLKRIGEYGPVNLEALDEYNKERERLSFLENQAKDIDEAERILIETIGKISHTAHERLVRTFQLVKQNFLTIYKSFFTNGEADMIMRESPDPLEANIDIYAQPYGKRIQSINLLSGGEKALTAIAILFAIYRVKPSPFCIFDEVDAPLDDINIARFVKVLNEFSKDTQFIVITHNKKTMEAARNLYGVTMEESGISKLISVRLKKESETAA